MTMKIDWMSIEDDFQAEAAYFWLRREGGLPAARHFHHPAEAPSFPAERSFGVRAASLPLSLPQACLRQFLLASLLAGIPSGKLSCGNLQPRLDLYSHFFPASTNASQRAGWGKSGSKLHALPSFAPCAVGDNYSKASLLEPRSDEKCGLSLKGKAGIPWT